MNPILPVFFVSEFTLKKGIKAGVYMCPLLITQILSFSPKHPYHTRYDMYL